VIGSLLERFGDPKCSKNLGAQLLAQGEFQGKTLSLKVLMHIIKSNSSEALQIEASKSLLQAQTPKYGGSK
jgi:hypothetical protein